jgi:TolB-like protein
MRTHCLFCSIFVITFVSVEPVCGQQKPTVAVLTLKNTNDISEGEAAIISDRLRVELFQTGNVEVMEREQMDIVLKEQGFQQSGACSEEGCMVEMGQMLGVKFIITGTIGRLGSMFILNCRSINVATAKIERVVSVDIKGEIEDVVGELSDVAWKLTSSKAAPEEEKQPLKVEQEREEEPEPEEEKKEEEERPYGDNPLSCENLPILEVPEFGGSLSFKVGNSTVEEICGYILESLGNSYRTDIRVGRKERIGALGASCQSPVVRMTLQSYSTQPSSMGQFIGTALVLVSVFDSPAAETPAFSVKIQESGDRHWGDDTPLANAFEEIAGTLEEQMKKSDYLKKFRRSRK